MLDAQEAVEDFRAETGMISAGDQGLITDQQLSGLNQQLLAARQQVEQQKTAYEQARQLNVSNVEAGAIPETLNSGALSGLRSRYSQALDRQAELAANLGNDHPEELNRLIAIIEAAGGVDGERVERALPPGGGGASRAGGCRLRGDGCGARGAPREGGGGG